MFGLKSLFKRKEYDIPDSWSVGQIGEHADIVARFNASLKDFAYKDDFPVSAVFTVSFGKYDAHSDVQFGFEDTLFETLQDSGSGVIVAIMTNVESRDFIIYAKSNKSVEAARKRMAKAFPDNPASVSKQRDPDWQLFHNMLPTD